MPPRSVTIGIVVFWLGVSSWLVWRDIWPRLAPGEPPPFTLDLMDSTQGVPTSVRWRVRASRPQRDTLLTANLTSSIVQPPGSDQLELRARLDVVKGEGQTVFPLDRVESKYQVDLHGRLLGLEASAQLGGLAASQKGSFTGTIRDGVCTLRWHKKALEKQHDGTLRIETPLNGLVVLPLHPVHRMAGIEPGRSWRVALLDPLDLVGFAEPNVVWVRFEVQEQEETLNWQRRDHSCRLVRYEGDNGNVKGTIWVAPALNFQVLQQRIDLGDTRWDIVRE